MAKMTALAIRGRIEQPGVSYPGFYIGEADDAGRSRLGPAVRRVNLTR